MFGWSDGGATAANGALTVAIEASRWPLSLGPTPMSLGGGVLVSTFVESIEMISGIGVIGCIGVLAGRHERAKREAGWFACC